MCAYQFEHYHKAAGRRNPGSLCGSWFVFRCPTVPPPSCLAWWCCPAVQSPRQYLRGPRRHLGFPISSPGHAPHACPPPCCLCWGLAWGLSATAGAWQRCQFRCCCASGAYEGWKWLAAILQSGTAPGMFPGTDQGWLEVKEHIIQRVKNTAMIGYYKYKWRVEKLEYCHLLLPNQYET